MLLKGVSGKAAGLILTSRGHSACYMFSGTLLCVFTLLTTLLCVFTLLCPVLTSLTIIESLQLEKTSKMIKSNHAYL